MELRDIFISYIEEDGPTAQALAQELRVQGQSTWTYEEDGVAGISYLTQIHQAIESCRVFVLLASAKSVHAHQVIREVEQAHEREKVIVTVRIGMTHEEFLTAHPILRMAIGTAVTLSVSETNFAAVARRIAASVQFGQREYSGIPAGPHPVPSAPGPVASFPTPVTPQIDSPVSPSGPFKSPGLWSRIALRIRSQWMWVPVWLGLIVQVAWGGLWSFGRIAMIGMSQEGAEGLVISLTSVWLVFVSAVVSIGWLVRVRRLLRLGQIARLVPVERSLYVSSIATSVGVLDGFLPSVVQNSGEKALAIHLPLLVSVSIIWIGLWMLKRQRT